MGMSGKERFEMVTAELAKNEQYQVTAARLTVLKDAGILRLITKLFTDLVDSDNLSLLPSFLTELDGVFTRYKKEAESETENSSTSNDDVAELEAEYEAKGKTGAKKAEPKTPPKDTKIKPASAPKKEEESHSYDSALANVQSPLAFAIQSSLARR